jgi:hypothetical protein
MKRWVLLVCLTFALGAQAHDEAKPDKKGCDPKVTAKAVANDAAGTTFGAPMPAAAKDAVPISRAAAEPGKLVAEPRAFSGRITDVCQVQGCWMVLEHEGAFARVMMHDHAFSVPKDAKGDAVVYGQLKVKQLSAEEVEHLSKEGRKPASANELTIDATSVRIGQG